MYDFISFANSYGATVTISPTDGEDLIRLLIEIDGIKEERTITQAEVMAVPNIDGYTEYVLGTMLEKALIRRAKREKALKKAQGIRNVQKLFEGV